MLRYFAANGWSGYWLVIWWFTAVALLGQKGTKRIFPVRQYFALCDGSFKIELIYVTNWIRSVITDKTTGNTLRSFASCIVHITRKHGCWRTFFLKIYKYMYDYIKTMDSIYCVLTPVSWVRTVNRFIFYYKHCIKLSYANFPLLLVLINIKLSAKLCPKSPEFKPGYIWTLKLSICLAHDYFSKLGGTTLYGLKEVQKFYKGSRCPSIYSEYNQNKKSINFMKHTQIRNISL